MTGTGTSTATDHSFLFFSFAAGLALRLLISASLLNAVYPYSSTGGALYEKLHPGTYIIYLVAFLLATGKRSSVNSDHQLLNVPKVIPLAIVFIGVIGLATGRTTSMGFLFDSVMLGPVSVYILLHFSKQERLLITKLALICVYTNALFVVLELILGRQLLPSNLSQAVFRPAGLIGHPLLTGLFSVSSIPVTLGVVKNQLLRLALCNLCVGACLASGARFATLVAVILVVLLVVVWLSRGSLKKVPPRSVLLYVWLNMIFLCLVGFVFRHLPIVQRVSLNVGSDHSILERVNIYRVISLLPTQDLLLGTPYAQFDAYLRQYNLAGIESPVVASILLFGIIGGIVFLAACILFFSRLYISVSSLAKSAIVVLVLVGLSNNTFTTKGPAFVFVVAITAYSLNEIKRIVGNVYGSKDTLHPAVEIVK